MAEEPLGHVRAVAERETVAPHPPRLQMAGLDDEHVAFPSPGREALPGVRIEVRRMRTAVGPDLAPLLHPLDVRVDLADREVRLVEVIGDPQVADAAEAVGRWMRLARVLLHRQDAGVPRLASHPSGIVDRQTQVVADLGTRRAFDLVLVHDRRPDAGEIDLRGRRPNGHNPDDDDGRNQGDGVTHTHLESRVAR